MLALFYIQFCYPQLIIYYDSEVARFLNLIIAFVAMAILVTLSNNTIKKHLKQEEAIAKDKAQELKDASEDAERNRDLLSTLKDLQSTFLIDEELKESFNKLLEKLLAITGSEYGFIGEVLRDDEDDSPYLKTHATTNISWNKETSDFYDKNVPEEMVFWNLETLFGHVMKTESHVISNSPYSDKRSGGLSEGHPDLNTFLGLPVMHNKEMVGMLGIANRENGYDEDLVNFLRPFLSTYGTVIQNIRLKRTQKKYEKELRLAKEKAEESVRLKSQFLTNISHELRTPLSLIIGPITSLLRQNPEDIQIPSILKSLGMIKSNSNKMLLFIEDIMDLAKLNSEKLEVQTSTNHMYSFIQEIYSLFKIETTYRDIDFILKYTLPQSTVLNFDTRKVEKVINNLLSNAFKFTKDGGKIIFSITQVEGHVKVEIQDTGMGIDPDDLPHIFDRFYQTKDVNKPIFSGTGVGLALSQELAQIQGFQIFVSSILFKGSCFSFLLPAELEENYDASGTIDTTKKVNNLTPIRLKKEDKLSILIVEDSLEMSEFLKETLENEKYQISLAENGLVGLDILENNPMHFDLVITDLMMPEMDGFGLLESLRSTSWGMDLPVIVLTAKTGEKNKLKALKIGIDEYLTKPFVVDELITIIQNSIQNNHVRKIWNAKKKAEWKGELDIQKSEIAIPKNKELLINKSGIDQERVILAKEIVLKNIDVVSFSVENLAKGLTLSTRQLYRFMQLNIGITPLHFIKEIRLLEARSLLENKTYKSVKEVSYATGFGTVRHFSKSFISRFSKKPSSYLK